MSLPIHFIEIAFSVPSSNILLKIALIFACHSGSPLSAATQIGSANSARTAAATRTDELTKLRATVATAEARPSVSPAELETARKEASQARQQLAASVQEVTTLRSQVSAARDLETRVRQLEAEKAAMPADLYKKQLTQLLLELAKIQEALDKGTDHDKGKDLDKGTNKGEAKPGDAKPSEPK